MDNKEFYSLCGRCDGVLRAIMVSHPADVMKSEAFIFVLNCQVLLLDGGMTGCTEAYDRLMKLRENIAPGGKLRLTWVLSHYHVDHVATVLEKIISDPAFEFETIYLPPKVNLPEEFAKYGDVRFRHLVAKMIKEYQPQAKVVTLRFVSDGGFREYFECAGAKVTLMPPDCDWSSKRELNDIIIKGYYGGNMNVAHPASCVVNSASVWMKISYAGRRMLFTGDSMKRTSTIQDESFDRMLAHWRHYFEHADLVKWPHHGYKRDNAASGVLSLKPKYVLTTSNAETASKHTEEKYPNDFKKTQFINCADKDICLRISPDGILDIYD